MATITITDNELKVHMDSIKEVLAFKKQFSIPLKHIDSVKSASGLKFPNPLQKRIGTNVPHLYYGGTFRQKGKKTFWDVHNRAKAIVINLKNEKYDRLILEVENPEKVLDELSKTINS
ncbi:MAG: PH domain-containing protein [Micrococcaceae bacterium]